MFSWTCTFHRWMGEHVLNLKTSLFETATSSQSQGNNRLHWDRSGNPHVRNLINCIREEGTLAVVWLSEKCFYNYSSCTPFFIINRNTLCEVEDYSENYNQFGLLTRELSRAPASSQVWMAPKNYFSCNCCLEKNLVTHMTDRTKCNQCFRLYRTPHHYSMSQ